MSKALSIFPCLLMIMTVLALSGFERPLAGLASTTDGQLMLGRFAVALPYVAASIIGVLYLFACVGHGIIRGAGTGVAAGAFGVVAICVLREALRLLAFDREFFYQAPPIQYVDPATTLGAVVALLTLAFATRVALIGSRAFPSHSPKRVRGRRAIHGDAKWMTMKKASSLFPPQGGIVIGEAYRVDRDDVSALPFRAGELKSWGRGGKAKLLRFDGSFGSSHGLVFAGSGGYKTTSVTIPTALNWAGGLVVLDPSNEVAPMVKDQRERGGRDVFSLDPRHPGVGFNALDWLGRFGGTDEQDIAAVASWIMSDTARTSGARDDFFRVSALHLLTALIGDVCLSGHTPESQQTLRQVRRNLAEPEAKLRERLSDIHSTSKSQFVRENVAPFVNMTPETFSGVYANAVKETHWLSYENFAALVSGNSFSTDAVGRGEIDVFINIDLKTLETHSGLARVIIGAQLTAIYNRDGQIKGRTLFLLDEAARLGYMRVLETARDAGRKYGITLIMIYQSIGQLRETYGGADASSKWFESASWVSFAAINDPDTAEYISRRCGMTTVETDQTSWSSQARGSSRTRSKQLASRPLILSHEVLQMRSDEQIVFTAGNPPLRCGRAIWFRRQDMKSKVASNRFHV